MSTLSTDASVFQIYDDLRVTVILKFVIVFFIKKFVAILRVGVADHSASSSIRFHLVVST
jgi:hypothetical protein